MSYSVAQTAREPYEYQELERQRANAENDLVNVRASWHRDTDYWRDYVTGDNAKWQAMDEWLSKYIAGVDAQRRQAAIDAEQKAAHAAEAARRSR